MARRKKKGRRKVKRKKVKKRALKKSKRTKRKPRVLITGASGRVGTALVKRLMKEGYRVRALVRDTYSADQLPSGIEIAFGDITDLEGLRGCCEKVEVVYHLAALIDYQAGWPRLYEVNSKGTVNVVTEAARAKVKRLVYASSIGVYGKGKQGRALKESDALEPSDDYGRSKLDGEIAVWHSNLPFIALRFGLVYGPGFDEAYMPLLKMLEKRRMPYVGHGQNIMPFVHVNDVVEALVVAGSKNKEALNHAYNIVGERVTQKQAFNLACRYLGVGRPLVHASPAVLKSAVKMLNVVDRVMGRKPKLVPEYIEALEVNRDFDTEKARKVLGWKPKVEIKEGIQEMVEYYKSKTKG